MGEIEGPKPRRAGPVRLVPGISRIEQDDGTRTVEVVGDLPAATWQAIEATCGLRTPDLVLRDQVRWAVAIFAAWEESAGPADPHAMPTETERRRIARAVAAMARSHAQARVPLVVERAAETRLARAIVSRLLRDLDEDEGVSIRAGTMRVRDPMALRLLATRATQLAETYRDRQPSNRRGPKPADALVELVGRLVVVIEDRLGPETATTWWDIANGTAGGTLDAVVASLTPFLPGLEKLSPRALQHRLERALAAYRAIVASRSR